MNTIKTPEQIAERISENQRGNYAEAEPAALYDAALAAIEADRAQRDGALIDDLRQIRRQDGDWRGLLDNLIGDEDEEA